MWALWTWLFCFFFVLAILLIVAYQLLCLIDLEYDYINPYDSASRINMFVLPEFITQGVLCIVYLITGHWLICLLSLPYLYYNVDRYVRGQHLVDVTEIYRQLGREKKIRFFKIGYLIIVFVFSLFWLLFTLEDEYE